MGGLLEIGDCHFVFAELVEADAAAEIGVGQFGVEFDRLREGADGGAIFAEHAFGDAAAIEHRSAGLSDRSGSSRPFD